MKECKLTISSLLMCMILFHSCGDAGFGFDVTSDYPITAPVEIALPASPVDVDPDITVINYNLNDVGAFDDALDELQSNGIISPENIELLGISYEITGVDASEQLPLDEIAIDIMTSSSTISIPVATGQLSNLSKTDIPLTPDQESAILNDLQNLSRIDTDVIVDLGIIPASSTSQNVNFDFNLYFNVLLKVRDL